MRASGWVAAFCSLALAGPALAVPITLSLTDAGGGGDCEAGSTCTITNPAYQEGRNDGEMPSSILIDGLYAAIPTSLFAQTGITTLTLTFDAEPVVSVVPQTASTWVFELSLHFDDPSATPVHELTRDIDLAFEVGPGHWLTPLPSPAVLGYLDESRNPPVWVAEDSLSGCGPGSGEGSRVCGKANHLSFFSIAPIPEPTTALLVMCGLAVLGAARRRA